MNLLKNIFLASILASSSGLTLANEPTTGAWTVSFPKLGLYDAGQSSGTAVGISAQYNQNAWQFKFSRLGMTDLSEYLLDCFFETTCESDDRPDAYTITNITAGKVIEKDDLYFVAAAGLGYMEAGNIGDNRISYYKLGMPVSFEGGMRFSHQFSLSAEASMFLNDRDIVRTLFINTNFHF